ncbi:MAG: cytochrome c [Mesorhizobium sp.]
MKRILAALAIVVLAAGAASADVISDREALMKERGGAVGALSKVAKGETAFDAAAVMAQLQALQANAAKAADIDALWPEGSAGDSEASPKIWEDRAGFKAAADKYLADVEAVLASAPADAAALGAAIPRIATNCGVCHGAFRVKK